MKISLLVASRPVIVFVLLAVIMLIIPSIMIPYGYKTAKRMERDYSLVQGNLRLALISEIENAERIFQPLNTSAINLAKVLDLSGRESTHKLSFTEIATKMGPVLFEGYMAIPHVSQVSYIGLAGLFLSFFKDQNRTQVLFSNSTFPPYKDSYTWYVQNVDQDTGRFYGNAVEFQSSDVTNTVWFRRAMENEAKFAAIGTGWDKTSQDLILNTVGLRGKKGAVSLGFSVKTLTDVLGSLKLYDGRFDLSTIDGKMLLGDPSTASFVFSNNSMYFHLIKHGGDRNLDDVGCDFTKNVSGTEAFVKQNSENLVRCSVLEIAGAPLVYALVFPNKGLRTLVARDSTVYLILFSVAFVVVIASIFGFVLRMVQKSMREIHLTATLINQMEMTQQAERKSMRKSLALATASHDIRTSLTGITGLVELCFQDVDGGSKLATNLKQIHGCATDLLGFLNSILDTSKIEAGKMQLEEEEFDLAELLEEVVDSFHPAAIKKGVDVVLDTGEDMQNLRFSHLQGDRGKLKQVLTNLMSNAVKFTSEGRVLLRGRAQKPGSESPVALASNSKASLIKCLPFLYCKTDMRMDVEAANSIRRDLSKMEFVFEIDDTGKGIPKEKWQSVFEDYVQVKETAQGHQGTGLGLGIVQSLVRLMGGEIRIMEKEMGQKGTCFRFNVFLTASGTASNKTTTKVDIEAKGPNGIIPSLSQRLASTQPDGSRVVLLIKDEERNRVVQKYMENLKLLVISVDKWENLGNALKRIKPSIPGFVLLVIDARAGPFQELYDAVERFRGKCRVEICCKIVWLNKPSQHRTTSFRDEVTFLKPLHGSRLLQLVKMLPEFQAMPKEALSSSRTHLQVPENNKVGEMKEEKNAGNDEQLKERTELWPSDSEIQAEESSRSFSFSHPQTQLIEDISKKSEENILAGMRVLVAEDTFLHATIARKVLKNLGASIVDECVDGAEAAKVVCDHLKEQCKHQESCSSLPYDYIFMDSEMPNMDGYKATKVIREEESRYGIHIPIIAVTAHESSSKEANRLTLAGVDALLNKPLREDSVMEAIKHIHSKQNITGLDVAS